MRAALFLAGVVAAPAAAQGRTDFSFRRDLAAGARLVVSNIIGDVRIEPASGRTFEATATKLRGRYGNPEDVEIRTVELSDGVALCVVYPHQRSARDDDRPSRRRWGDDRRGDDDREDDPCERNGNWSDRHARNDTEVDFVLRVPAGLKLRARTVSGDVSGESLRGDVHLRSVSGDVRLAGGEGPRIALSTVSGHVDLLRIRAPDVEGHTVSGRITFEGPIDDRGTYDFVTTSGDITVTVPGQPNATLSAATFSGRFASAFPTSASERRSHRRSRHSAVWGNGSARLDVESLSGDITIRTSQP